MKNMRMMLVLPITFSTYFKPKSKGSIAWQAGNVVRIAEFASPGSAVEVLMYGAEYASETIIASSTVNSDSLTDWVEDWGTSPNSSRKMFADELPKNEFEKVFGGVQPKYGIRGGLPLPAAERVSEMAADFDGAVWVLFHLDTAANNRELVQHIHEAQNERVLWQFFGNPDRVNSSFWRRDGLDRGRVLPNVRFGFDANWSRRAFLREFSRWRAVGASG